MPRRKVIEADPNAPPDWLSLREPTAAEWAIARNAQKKAADLLAANKRLSADAVVQSVFITVLSALMESSYGGRPPAAAEPETEPADE